MNHKQIAKKLTDSRIATDEQWLIEHAKRLIQYGEQAKEFIELSKKGMPSTVHLSFFAQAQMTGNEAVTLIARYETELVTRDMINAIINEDEG